MRIAAPRATGVEAYLKKKSMRLGSCKTPIGGNQFVRARVGARDRHGSAGNRLAGVSDDATHDPAIERSDPGGGYSETGEVRRHQPEQVCPLYFSAVEHESGNDGILGGFELEWDSGSHGTNGFAYD